MKVINRLNLKNVVDLFCSRSAPKFIFYKVFRNFGLRATFKNANMIHIRSQDNFRKRFRRILFHVPWIVQLTRRSYFIISLINMTFELYKSLPVKLYTLMTFQWGLIKFGIIGSILLWNILLTNCS